MNHFIFEYINAVFCKKTVYLLLERSCNTVPFGNNAVLPNGIYGVVHSDYRPGARVFLQLLHKPAVLVVLQATVLKLVGVQDYKFNVPVNKAVKATENG